MFYRNISPEDLALDLRLHQRWIDYDESGRCANFYDADLRNVNLSGVDLRYANFRGADLRGANLQGADLRDTDLRGANLRGANLRGTDLQYADLQGANLRSANLLDADLQHADLRRADLSGALCDPNIQKAFGLGFSKWLRSDIPWWLGHEDQDLVILCDDSDDSDESL